MQIGRDGIVVGNSNVALIATGSYTGDGTTSLAITGVGFTPNYLRIWVRKTSGGLITQIFETTDTIIDDNASGMAINYDDTANQHESAINAIISLDSDGFTVDDAGSDSHPNKSGEVYNFVAMGVA